MAKIIFEGWKVGMKKVSFTRLLHEKAGLSLKEAKNITDRLVDGGEFIELDLLDEYLARQIFIEAQNLNVIVRLEV